MAIVDIPGRDPLSVPDSWGQDEVTDFVRKSYPDLFEPAVVEAGPSPVRLGPDRAPLSPDARQARIESIRGTPEDGRRFQEEQSRIADLAALAADREAGGLRGLLASPAMEGPRRVAAGLADLLKIPGTFLDTQVVTPLLMTEATRPAGERIARLVSEFSKGIEGAQEQLRVTDRPDTGLSLRDISRTYRDAGPLAAAADAGTLGVEAIADSAAYILPQGLIARGFRSLGLAPKAANVLGSVAAVAPIETAQALSEYTEAGADPVAARFVAPMVGLINGALESITDAAVLSRLGGGDAAKKGAVKFLVGQVLGEGVTEGLQESTTLGGRALLTGEAPDAGNRIGTSVLAGMLAGGGLGGAVELANRITAPPTLDARGVPVDVARAPVPSGPTPVGSAAIPSAPVPEGTGAAMDYVPFGKRKRKSAIAFAQVAAEEGVADLVDFIPEAKRTEDGVPVEAEFSGGRVRIYTPNIESVARLRGALREEKAHGWIATAPGQVALSEFLTANPLTPEEQAKLQSDGYLQNEGEAPEKYLRRLSDEFVAKLNRDPKWRQWVGEAVAWVKNGIGVKLTNTQAGRLMLRNIRGTVPRTSAGVRQSLANPRSDRLARPFSSLVEGATRMSSWKDWYDRYQSDLRGLFGSDADIFQKFLSATSQATGVGGNVTLALKAYRQWLEGVPFEGYLPAVIKNLDRVAREEALAGAKISQYGAANEGDASAIAVDRHIVELLFNAKGAPPTPAQVRKAKSTISRVGAELGWTPREVQAALWAWNQARKGATPQSYDTYLKARAGEIADLRARLGASGDANRVRERSNTGVPGGGTPRYSLAPNRVEPLLTEIRNQYPSAPTFVISDTPDRRGAFFDGTNISISPADLSGNPAAAKSAVVAAMVDSGLNLFPATFVEDTYGFLRGTDPVGTARIADRLGVDPKTPEGQRAVVTQALRLQAEEGRMRPWLRRWMQRLRLAPTNPLADALTRASKAILAGYEIPEAMLGRRVTSQDQVYADLHAGIWQYAKPIVDRIRDLALDSRFASEDERMFRNMANRMQSLAASGRARDIGSRNTDRIWNPRDAKFIDDLRDAGVPVTDSDARTHEQYRFEAEARALASVLDTLDDLLDLLDRLARTAPAFDRTEDEATLKKLQTRIEKADPDALARAEDLRRSRARKWASKAAAQALLDPQIRAWLEIIERIEETGTVPRDTAEGNLADAQRIIQDTMFLSWRPFRKRTQEVLDEFMSKAYPETLVRLREALEKQQSSRVSAHVAVGEILAAISGKLGLSGSPEDRATVDFLRENDELLRRFIVALAQASPDDAIARLRRRVLGIPDTAPIYDEAQAQLDAELGVSTFVEVPRYEISGISPDDVRELFGMEARTRSPDLYDWFAKLSTADKKEIVKKALRGIVDDRLAQFGTRKQVGVDRAEVPGRAPTADELRSRFESLVRDRMQAEGLADIQAAAEASGISYGSLSRLLSLIEQSPGHRNAVVDTYTAVNKELTQSAIAAIKGIEDATTDEGRKEAVQNATKIMKRFVRARGDAVDTLRGIEQEIAQLEARREGLELLRDAGATEVPESELATSEMLYDAADGGILFRGFTRADGTQQPEIRILPRDEYTGELLVRLMEWQQSAEAAIMTGVNPDPITRGLQVALPLSDFYVDSKFTRDQITSTKAPGKMQDRLSGSPLLAWLNIATRETLSMLVPGVMGRRLRVKLSAYADAGRTIDKMVRRHAAKNRKLMVAAAESLGLDLNNEGDAILLQRARNELAHRLGRQFDADVGVDSLLIELPGRRVTPELVNLLRNDRAIGREAQRAGLNRPYGGTRIELPGERAVRQPGETGTIGLARIAQRSIYQELARVYRTKDPVQIAAFWDSPTARNGLLWHVLDSVRVDLGTERNRELQDAERKVASRIFQGAPVPRTLDEMITALSAESGLTRAETRTRLLSELAEYGKVAMARIPSAEGTAVNTSAISMHGESDLTEFTQAAAPLMFPSSWYTYGLSDSLNGFLERTGDPQQVEYLRAVQEAAESLRSTATAISEALTKPREESAELLAKYKGDILWHTNGIWSGQNISRERADTAVKRMRLRASRLDAEVSELQNPTKNWQSSVQRTIASVIPWMLMWIPTMIKNVASGPWATRLPLRPFVGTGPATALAAASMLGSIPHLAYDRLVAAARAAGVNLETFEEILAYMESSAISGSYSRAELGESEAWARGEVQRPLERVLTQASDTARKIGEYTGTPIGDTTLNRMMIRTTVPISILRLKRIARTWKARLAKAGLDPSQRDDPRTALSDEDLRLGDPAGVRDWLGAIGSPEEILDVIDEVPTRAFWRHPLGVAIGNHTISQVNTATRANRPSASPLLALLGWSSNVLNQLAADARTTPEDSRLSKVSGFAVKQLSWMALSAMAYYWSMILARQANAIQTELAESLQQILLGLDGDDQDEEGLFEALVGMAQMLRKIPGVSPVMDAGARVAGAMKSPPATGESTPLDASFWEQSGKDIAKQTVMAVPKGLGFDIENPRIPAFGILSQLAQGVFQAGSAGLTAAGDPTPEGLAGAKADAKESLRKVLSVFSMAGQFAYNLMVPETVVSKQVKAEVVEAARSVGIEPSKPPLFRGFMSATPKEQALREAARRQDEASLRNIAGFAYKQAYENALAKGKTPEEAASAGEQSVKALLVQLDPVRDAVGGPVSEEQYAKLLPKLGPKVREAVAQKDWAVRVLSERPPEPMRPFAPTEAMETPVRQAPGRRVSFRAPRKVRGRRSRYLRRGRRRRLRVRV